MLLPVVRAIRQLPDPALFGVLWRSVLLALAAFVVLVAGCASALRHSVGEGGAWSWLAGAAGGIVALLAALWLFLPVAIVIASLYLERVCRAVERRFYPGLPPPDGASVAAQAWDGLAIGVQVLALQLFAVLLALLLPGIGLLLGWAVSAWAIGRGLFVAVAMRRMDRAQAMRRYRRQRPAVLLQGLLLALAAGVPGLNLLVPVRDPVAHSKAGDKRFREVGAADAGV